MKCDSCLKDFAFHELYTVKDRSKINTRFENDGQYRDTVPFVACWSCYLRWKRAIKERFEQK